MSRERIQAETELDFLQAYVKRGFVNIPRMLFDWMPDLELDYDTIGRLFTVLACVGGSGENAFGAYAVSRKANPNDFDQVRSLMPLLEERMLVKCIEEDANHVTFSLIPLFSRLRTYWLQYQEQYDEEQADGKDPLVNAAEQLLGRPLSDREIVDIQDWTTAYGFDVPMVRAVIREGLDKGVTRMTYLNTVARQWHEQGITTPEEAEQYAQSHRKAAAKHKGIVQNLGLTRQITPAEQALLDKWTEEWGFSNEVIVRACTEAAGRQYPLQYVNKVLESWKQAGVKTVADADQLQVEYKRRNGAAENGGARKSRAPSRNNNSNVFVQREKKDDKYYDHIFEKLGE
jgi:DnaD/phage-associated family protein